MRFLKADKFDYNNFNFTPGPGHYERPNSKPTRHIPTGSKPIPYTAFAQGSNRFDEPSLKINVGPGQYFGISDWSAKPKKETKSQPPRDTRKIVTIPSIPASTHAMGYVEREDGYLVPLNGAHIKEEHDMGPGTYFPADKLTKRKVLGFSLEKGSVRFPMKKVEEIKPKLTPEVYDLPEKKLSEREVIVRKKEKPKKEETLENPIEKFLNKPDIPPGHYYNEKLASSFNVKTKAPEFQNFGSTSKRFVSTVPKGENPGPGAYGVPNLDTSNIVYNVPKQEPFSKGDIRFRGGIEDLPGPGMYDANFNLTPAGALSNAHSTFAAAFGSGANRFASPKIDMNEPGPGSYEINRKPKRNKKKKGGKLTVPPQYFSANNSQSRTGGLDLDLGGRTKGAVTVKHEVISKGTAAFVATVPRFKEDGAREDNPGPGFYSSNKNELIKPSFKSSKENFSLAPRDQMSKLEQYKSYLGPGSYEGNVELIKPKTNYIPKINPLSPFADVTLAR